MAPRDYVHNANNAKRCFFGDFVSLSYIYHISVDSQYWKYSYGKKGGSTGKRFQLQFCKQMKGKFN